MSGGCHCPWSPHIAIVPTNNVHSQLWDSAESILLRAAIADSIRIGVERATVWPPPSDNNRIMVQTSVRIEDAPCDLAFEILWPAISSEAFATIWARKGEDSHLQPVGMVVPTDLSAATSQAWVGIWPPTHIQTIDVLIRPSLPVSEVEPHHRLDLMLADMREAWSDGAIWIENVPIQWGRGP
jgi:hypothetical protein